MTFETGTFHECYKYAKNFKPPIKFVVEDNGLSTNTPTKSAWKVLSKKPNDGTYYNTKRISSPWYWFLDIILMKKLKYKSELIRSMSYLAKNQKTIFIANLLILAKTQFIIHYRIF